MPIQEQNIVFVESQVMDDVPEGGGAATGRVIEDGRMNNVFEDISDLDRAYGRFNLRKIFVAVRTASTDLFAGAKSVITALPIDDSIGFALFSTGDAFDTRTQAANRVEAYLYKGATWGGYLWENHITGMRSITLLQRIGTQLPVVGQTLCLVQLEGQAGQLEQYVRVTRVTVTEREFEDQTGVYRRWQVVCDLSDALRYNFTGHEANRLDANYSYATRARVRMTTVADATRYYGAQRLLESASIGDLRLRAASMFTTLVPSAQTETPLVNRLLNSEAVVSISAGARTVEVSQQAHTLARSVTAESRRLNWIETLQPIPAPGALTLAYMSQGNWYTLTDNGTGTMSGSDPSIGAGTINYVSGSMAVTLGALPDVGSQILTTWASPVHYTQRLGAFSGGVEVSYQLEHGPVVPGSLVASFPVGGVMRTATDNPATGVITGTGVTGSISYADRRVTLRFSTLPDAGSQISNAYAWRDGLDLVTDGASAVISGGQFSLPGTGPFKFGGTLVFSVTAPNGANMDAPAYITDAGQVRVRQWGDRSGNNQSVYAWLDQPVGTLNATTGVVTLSVGSIAANMNDWGGLAGAEWAWSVVNRSLSINAVTGIEVERDTEAYDPQSVSAELVAIADHGLTLDVTPSLGDPVVPNSVRFTLAGKTYDDRDGTLYTDINPSTGSGTPAGSVDYGRGVVSVSFWTGAGSAAVNVTSCLTRYGKWTAVDAAFRTPVAPLKSEALSITATALDGTLISAVADADGDIVGSLVRGVVNYEFGTASVEFGELVAGVWEPRAVMPETIRYNAVSYSYLPLDADILGIDPVRLPADGRVPIYRPGDVVIIMHSLTTTPQSVSAGGEINLGRTRIGWVRITDANGDPVSTGYQLDRAAGVVTFDDVSGVPMPITVRHTVADLRQITDAQISGWLSIARPLTHNFPAGDTVVSSCLIHGDRRARVSAVWDQATWDNTWQDSIKGSAATATLNTIDFPIAVTNEGADTDRWVLRWTSTTNVELISEKRGLVWSGTYTSASANIAPINPRTRTWDESTGQWIGGVPYLTIPAAANGGGWAAGNVVRINTVGAIADMWVARSIQQSNEPDGDGADGFELYALGNVDRP